MHKLHATRYHVENYRLIEEAHQTASLERFKSGDLGTQECLDLIFELEAFLFQIKSSLDMLVKLMIPVLGNRVKTQTFAAKGDTLVRGLQQYLKDKSAQQEKVQDFIDMLTWSKGDWLANVIDIRDELNHHRGLTKYWFSPSQSESGEIIAVAPKFRDLDTFEFMKDTYGRNLLFHQDFACLALALVSPKPFILMEETRDFAVKEYGEYSFCIKWTWGAHLPNI